MKLVILVVMLTVLAFGQSSGTASQQAKDCSQNFIGNNNTGTITCYNVDKKLAEQVAQLVSASKRDGKTLKDISDKVQLLLTEIQSRSSATNVFSFNQQGGITAGQVNIVQGAVRITTTQLSTNQKDGQSYVSKVVVSFSGEVPEFAIAVSGSSVTGMTFGPEKGGVMTMVSNGNLPDGRPFHRSQRLYGSYLLEVRSSQPGQFRIEYQCGGVTCVGP